MSNWPKVVNFIADTRKILWTIGLYHGARLPKCSSFDLRRAVMMFMIISVPTLIATKMLSDAVTSTMFIKASSFLFVTIWLACRCFIFIKSLPKLLLIEDLLENNVFDIENRHQHLSTNIMAHQKILFRIYLLGSCFFLVCFMLQPMLTGYFVNVPMWTPFSGIKESIVIYIYEIIYIMQACISYGSLYCILVGLIMTIVVQIKILKENLKHSAYRTSHGDYLNQEQVIQNRLRNCIIHHNAIIDFANRLENLFSTSMFCQIIFSVLQICFSGMLLIAETDPMELTYWSVYFIFVLGEMVVSCWCGQEIINESTGIIEACYMSEWYACTPSTRKMLFIIMERAKRPITLNGGPFFTLSFATYMNILRSAYSYYAVFSQIYNK